MNSSFHGSRTPKSLKHNHVVYYKRFGEDLDLQCVFFKKRNKTYRKQSLSPPVLTNASNSRSLLAPLAWYSLNKSEPILMWPLVRLGSQVRRNFPRYDSYWSSVSTIPATVNDLLVPALQGNPQKLKQPQLNWDTMTLGQPFSTLPGDTQNWRHSFKILSYNVQPKSRSTIPRSQLRTRTSSWGRSSRCLATQLLMVLGWFDNW